MPEERNEPLFNSRSVSYGGGVQSTALLVLAATGRINFPVFLFANVGDDSEHPATLTYVRNVAIPYAAAHNIELIELHRTRRDGTTETLRHRISTGRMAIPVRRRRDGPPMSRSCTADFKIQVIDRELRRRGATPEHPALVALGISVDEIERARNTVDPAAPAQRRCYPLLDLGMHRRDCAALIASVGLPVPPKSACWFCPFHDTEAWRRLKRERPDLFLAATVIEAQMSAATRDHRPVFLTRTGRPLADAVDDQTTLPGLDACDTGWCMT